MKFTIKIRNLYIFIIFIFFILFIFIINDFHYLVFSILFINVLSYFLGLILLNLLKIQNSSNNYISTVVLGLSIIIILTNLWFLLNRSVSIIFLRIVFLIIFGYGLFIFHRKYAKDNSKLKQYFFSNIDKENFIIFIFIFILLFIVLFPLRGLYVAPLHDPLAISLISKNIVKGNFTLNLLSSSMQFYPNGLAVLVSLISAIFKLDYAKELLYITNIFNFLTGIAFYYLGREIFQKKIGGSICLFVSMFVSYFPLSLYYIAGKNAQILGYFTSIIAVYYMLKIINTIEFNYKNAIILAILLAGSHYSHYNSTVFIIGIFLGVFILMVAFPRIYKMRVSNILLNYGLIIILMLILLIPNLLIIKKVGGVKFDVTSKVFISKITLSSFVKSFLIHTKLTAGKILKYVWLSGLITIIPIIILKKYTYLKIYILLLIILSWIMFLTSGISEKYNLFFISSSFSAMLTFIPLVLFFSFFILFLFEMMPKKYINILLLIIIITSILSGLWRLDKYENARKRSVVSKDDIKAFHWINRNIKDNMFFIGRVAFTSTSFLTDAALYIPYYCNKDILLNFVGTENFDRDNKNDIQLYKTWISDFGKKETIEKLLIKNIKYIYIAKKSVFGNGGLKQEDLEKYKDLYKKIYSHKGTTIWKIN